MRRRYFLAVGVTLALAGCADRLGLVDRLEISHKRLTGEVDGQRVTIAEHRLTDSDRIERTSESTFDAADDRDGDRLEITESMSQQLEGQFSELRYEVRACEPGDATRSEADCLDTVVFRDDFNDIGVGDLVDFRVGEETAGVVSVVERRES